MTLIIIDFAGLTARQRTITFRLIRSTFSITLMGLLARTFLARQFAQVSVRLLRVCRL
jgi:hypothetical protein